MATLLQALQAVAWPAARRVVTLLPRLTSVPAPRASFASPRALGGLRAACSAAAGAPDQRPAGGGAQLMRRRKRRLDEVCLERHPEHSRNVIQSWIAQGKVLVNDQPVTKAGAQVADSARVAIIAEQPRFVCRAGLKLEAALDAWAIDVAGLRCLDAGLSTGGFTDCLLQRGAAGVVGVDVGYGQVAERVRTDPRVRVMERTNLRALRLPDIGGAPVDLVSLDLSFISVLKVLDAVCDVLRPDGGQLVVLIKPQFEAGKAQVSAGGVVRDPAVHREVVERVVGALAARGFACRGWRPSPIKGATSGNTEFLAYFVREGPSTAAGAAAAAAAGDSAVSSDAVAAEEAAAASAAAAEGGAAGAAAAGPAS